MPECMITSAHEQGRLAATEMHPAGLPKSPMAVALVPTQNWGMTLYEEAVEVVRAEEDDQLGVEVLDESAGVLEGLVDLMADRLPRDRSSP